MDEDVDKIELLNNKVQTLQKQLVDEQEIADSNRAAENEIRERVMYLDHDLKAEKDRKITTMYVYLHAGWP